MVQLISDPIEGGGDPAGIHNENYDDSLASSTGSNSAAERSDSGLDHSADELDRRQNFSLDDDDEDDLADEGVFHEDPLVILTSFRLHSFLEVCFVYTKLP